MSAAARIYVAPVFRKTPLVIMARVTGASGDPITQSDLSSISCSVYDTEGTSPTTPTAAPAVSIGSSVYDTLQTTALDPLWTADSTGYNFKYTFPASALALAHTYRVEFKFTPLSGDPFPLVLSVPCAELYSF